jgi:hypothetical protein
MALRLACTVAVLALIAAEPTSAPTPPVNPGPVPGKYSSCGAKVPSTVKDCDKPNFGGCGNACAIVEAGFVTEPEALYNKTRKWLTLGGPDGSYEYRTGHDSAGHDPVDDLRPYNGPFDFCFQGGHLSIDNFTDIFDINIRKNAVGGSIMRVGLTATIHGALGDNGQSYKIIAFMLKALSRDVAIQILWGGDKASETSSLLSSPKARPTNHIAADPTSAPTPPVNPGPVPGKYSSCGATVPSTVTDCDHPDLGSCGNACAIVETQFKKKTEALYNKTRKWLTLGGPDGSYSYHTGHDSGAHDPSDDLRPYNGAWDFILQVHIFGRGLLSWRVLHVFRGSDFASHCTGSAPFNE